MRVSAYTLLYRVCASRKGTKTSAMACCNSEYTEWQRQHPHSQPNTTQRKNACHREHEQQREQITENTPASLACTLVATACKPANTSTRCSMMVPACVLVFILLFFAKWMNAYEGNISCARERVLWKSVRTMKIDSRSVTAEQPICRLIQTQHTQTTPWVETRKSRDPSNTRAHTLRYRRLRQTSLESSISIDWWTRDRSLWASCALDTEKTKEEQKDGARNSHWKCNKIYWILGRTWKRSCTHGINRTCRFSRPSWFVSILHSSTRN